MRSKNQCLVQKPDNNALLHIKVCSVGATAKLWTKNDSLIRFLDRDEVHLAVFYIKHLTAWIVVVIAFEFVYLTFKKDQVPFFSWFHRMLFESAWVNHVTQIFELLQVFLRWNVQFLHVKMTLEDRPRTHYLSIFVLKDCIARQSHWGETTLVQLV